MSCPISDRFIRYSGLRRETINILGAASFICGIIRGRDVNKAAWLGNACGDIVVTRYGCSISMPTTDEVMAFAKDEAFDVF